MEPNKTQSFGEPFGQLSKLASFILEQNLCSFVNDHFERCFQYRGLSSNQLPAHTRQETLNVFHRSCENLLQGFRANNVEKTIQQSIGHDLVDELAAIGKGEFTIDDIVMINGIRAESLKNWIGEYTDNLSVALSIVKEVDNFITTYNRIAFQRYYKALTPGLAAKNKASRISNKNLREFAAVVSCDLKVPLRRVSGYLEIVREDISRGNTNDVFEYLINIKRSTARISQLIDNILTFCDLDDQHDEMDHCDLQSVLEDVIKTFDSAIKEKDATIIVGSLPTIRAVTRQMTQLFQNLLTNSLKCCKNNLSPIVKISSEVVNRNGRPTLLIAVKDNCIGCRKKHSAKVFAVFARLHSGHCEGTGLGLLICKRIAENHAGSISVSSEEGVGTTFKIALPMQNSVQISKAL